MKTFSLYVNTQFSGVILREIDGKLDLISEAIINNSTRENMFANIIGAKGKPAPNGAMEDDRWVTPYSSEKVARFLYNIPDEILVRVK